MPLEKLDSFLVDGIAQPIVNFLGISNWTIAKNCLWVSLTAAAVNALFYDRTLVALCLLVFLSLSFLFLINYWSKEEKKMGAASSSISNRFRLFFPWGIGRLNLLADAVIMCFGVRESANYWLVLLTFWLALAGFYFSACSQPPPHRKIVLASQT